MANDDDGAAPFASGSITEHVLRGLIGFAAIALAVIVGESANGGWLLALAIGLAMAALIAFRGCPFCWLAGLFATWRKVRR